MPIMQRLLRRAVMSLVVAATLTLAVAGLPATRDRRPPGSPRQSGVCGVSSWESPDI